MRPPVPQLPRVNCADIDLAQKLGVVGDGRKVEWALDLCLEGGVAVFIGQEECLAFRVTIGIPRIVALAGDVGVE